MQKKKKHATIDTSVAGCIQLIAFRLTEFQYRNPHFRWNQSAAEWEIWATHKASNSQFAVPLRAPERWLFLETGEGYVQYGDAFYITAGPTSCSRKSPRLQEHVRDL